MAQTPDTPPDKANETPPSERAPSAAQAALTLIAANAVMKIGTSALRGTIERTILRGQFGNNAAERILKEKTVKGSGLASRAAKIATTSKPGALVVGTGLFAKLLFDKSSERRARLGNKNTSAED